MAVNPAKPNSVQLPGSLNTESFKIYKERRLNLSTFVQTEDGRICYNPLVDFIGQYTLKIDKPNNVITMAALAQSGQFPMSVNSHGHFEGHKLTAKSSGPATIKLHSEGINSTCLMNDEIHLDCMVGSGMLPALLSEPLFVPARSSLIVEFRDLSNLPGGNTVYFGIEGKRIYHESAPAEIMAQYLGDRKKLIILPYWYTTNNGAFTIAAGDVTADKTITIGSDHDFQAFKRLAVSTNPFTYKITHNSRTQSEVELHQDEATGTAEFPNIPSSTHMFHRNDNIEIEFTNLVPGVDNTIYFTLAGRAIFTEPSQLRAQ
jgi:hypothetical protein